HTNLGFVGGSTIVAGMEAKPIAIARATPPAIPAWGGAWKRWLQVNGNAVGSAFAQFDALPYETHYLDLDPTRRDPYGVPVVRCTYGLKENETRGMKFLEERLGEWLREAGASETWGPQP